MIKSFKSIGNFGIFNSFDWRTEVRGNGGSVQNFQDINIIYGRNYSGKTTLSRIIRAMETGALSDKFELPAFSVAFSDGGLATETSLVGHGKIVRVFNDDFVRDNLRFITNPDDNIEPFAILGDDNNKIEKEISAIEAELGSKEEGKETCLYAQKDAAKAEEGEAFDVHEAAFDSLNVQLKSKATDKKIGIKYKPERFGDQNYNIQKLHADIKIVLSSNYRTPTDEQLAKLEKLISENKLRTISPFQPPELNFEKLTTETESLVAKKISESDKIEELVKDAVLNRWVNDGRTHHKGKRDKCAFCDNPISEDRWKELDKHFDEESALLEKNIDALIDKIEEEKNTASAALSLDKFRFYSKFHNQFDELTRTLKEAVGKYEISLGKLVTQLKARKEDILNQNSFEKPDDASADLLTAWSTYESIRTESDIFTTSLSSEQASAKETLRLKEVSDYLITIGYQEQLSSIEELKKKCVKAAKNNEQVNNIVLTKEKLIALKKRELNDEEKGAKKVNEYLNNFFGHRFITLESKKDVLAEDESKQICFEVIRDGKKAYHLSEGECSLLAFCYFLAKLDDIDTRDSKPIIWIDDPISSLDGNHIFFVYSLLNAEIVSAGKFQQLFISTHNLNFLKYLNQLGHKVLGQDGNYISYPKNSFVVARQDKTSTIGVMPKYLTDYATEFNYLFHQIYKCAQIETVDDTNYVIFCNFGNNSRKFFEIYLYYKYPDQGMNPKTLCSFFGEAKIPAVLTDRINNEYSHLCGIFERGLMPVEVPEMQTAAKQIIERLKEDGEQYSSLLKSIGIVDTVETQP
ncbi:AAA family ATPase [Maridesulfovibrio ferrireducens]|uniref:AAA family ATPase n=1 Tax=Maridesulfovibrio ferrireducens TaxID=246191 RepID=UPI001A194AA6|nr:AAA family ATPase [Maridesulfovibrio ferrireducens]MBI9113241.1 AAA family ATPase [Maridesulfovibrio ferrireducens]